MKKRLLLLFTLFACFGMIQAQDVVLSDFEDQSTGSWYSWSTSAPISIAANPETTGNTSDYVLLFDQTATTWSAFAQWNSDGFLSVDDGYSTISVDVYSKDSSGTIKW